ncbi:signal peptidase I [Oscillatoria sp. FACHB-1406]|uniref:signal peptidase I n=1 Tax=Oscillatoria sp. FACHB-1406 TaxID=2692846 RepID=UPI0016864566|nr:signal peptidase I [Oscillatoria sp. FACHB-1406]MBD2580287.1 signal peptidase I [Oscillatoria sp. FACHB-1406]
MKTPPVRDPWLAVNLSLFFPGLGQFYAGYPLFACLWLLGQFSLLAIAFYSIFAPDGSTATALVCLIASAVLYIANLYDAFHRIYQHQPSPTGEKIPRTQKNPWFALFISRILPGLGQFYQQKAIVGGIFLGLTIACSQIGQLVPGVMLALPAIAALSSYHAYITFPQRQRFPSTSIAAGIASLFFCFGTLFILSPYWFNRTIDRFEIPSGSMNPTLQIGDFVFVRRDPAYRPQRGDIVVFRAPDVALKPEERRNKRKQIYFIKRVIGLPGEDPSVSEWRVYINGQPLKEPYLAAPPGYEIDPPPIPANAYFVLGDNRNESIDSHVWGYLSDRAIVGRAYKIYWPPQRSRAL